MRKIVDWVKKIFVVIFGEVTWIPPLWAQNAKKRLIAFAGKVFSIVRKRKKTSLGVALTIALVAAAFVLRPLPKVEKETEKIYLKAEIIAPAVKTADATENPPLLVRFDKSAAKIEQVDKEIKSDDRLTLDPKIDGTWKWQGDKELVFTPTKDWPVKQAYTLTIEQSFLPEHTVLEKNELTFSTPPFVAGIREIVFVSDPVDQERKTVVATLSFSHPVDKTVFEQRITMEYGTKDSKKEIKEFQFEVQYNKLATEAYIHSHNIPIPMDDTPMKVVIDKGVVAAEGGPGTEEPMEKSVSVPGMYSYFRVLSSEIEFARNKNNDPEQIIVLNTNIDVHESEIKGKLKAWVLPKDKPAAQGEEAEEIHSWSAEEVDAKVLKRSAPSALEHIPQEREYSMLHTLKFKAEVGRQIYIQLEKGTKAWGGYVLAKPYSDIQTTQEYPAELAILHEGAILSTSSTKKLSVMCRGIPGITIELARVIKSDVNHLVSQTGGRFDTPYFMGGFTEENIAEIIRENRKLENTDPSISQYTAIDFKELVAKYGLKSDKGLFVLKVSSWDPEKYIPDRTDMRLVLITDLGIIAKQDTKGNNYVFVQSIVDGSPKPNVEVAVLGKNGVPVIKARTDAEGLAALPSLADFVREKSPTAYMVSLGDDFSFLPIGRSDRFIDYSRFDVGGVTVDGSSDNLDAYLFSDRGIYRPGDEFHVGIIVKAADWTKPVDGLPLEIVVTDPLGQEVLTQKTALENSGFIEIAHKTEESSPTGNYTVSASLLKKNEKGKIEERVLLGSTSVRVEEFLPDAMTIKTDFTVPPTDGWVSPKGLAATVSLHNLYGTPAAERRVTGRISLSTKELSFKGYRDFIFQDPMKAEKGYVKTLDDKVTDENGETRFDIDLSEFDAATYALTFITEGFEAEGGRSVSSQAAVTVSPLQHIVGYKPDGGLSYINRDAKRTVDFIALNNKLQQIPLSSINATLYEKRYVSSLVRQYNGVFKYQSVARKAAVSKDRISIAKEGIPYTLKTDRPGEFILELESNGKTILSTVAYSVAGEANLARNLERTAELEVSLDKADYAPGEEILIHLKAPYKGTGLITIERDRVFAHKWFRADDTSSVQSIQVPNDVEVNAYVNIAMVRSADSKEIYMSPLTSAVVPFSLTREKRVSTIDLKVPDLVKPGDDMAIEYTASSPSKIVLFAVDEGILQAADYTTPDPLSHFLSKRALQVSTSQILDMILPEYEAFNNPSSAGGGEEETGLGRNLNPFKRKREKPVVFWSGIIDAGPTPQSVNFKIPDYFNGTVRTMAVSVSMDKLGALEKKTVVRGPFVIHASPPLFAAPGDTFDVSVTAANNVEGSGKNASVKLSLDVTDNLETVGSTMQALDIPEGREKTARFKLKAKARLGNATMTFKATYKNQSATASAFMSIRPKNPDITTIKAGFVKDDTATVRIERHLYPENRSLQLSVSSVPLVLADGLSAYLKKFPHGCTEQIVSQAVPALVLRDHKAFGYDVKVATDLVNQTIRMLEARQNSEGAFGYWAANSYASDQQTVYAVQFLTEAKERRYQVPAKTIENGLSYLKQISENSLDSPAAARLRAYAVYVSALNGELSSASLAELREYLALDKKNTWHQDVTLGYLAATYLLMQDRKEAESLVDRIDLSKDTTEDYEDFYDNQVYRGTMLHLLAEHFPEKLDRVDTKAIVKIADAVAKGNYNTLSSAQIIYGLEAYGRRVQAALGNADAPKIEVRQVLSKDNKPLLKLNGSLIDRSDFSEKATALEISSSADYPIFYQVSISGFDLDNASDAPVSNGVEVIREYRSIDKKPISKVALGDEIEVVLKLRSTKDDYISHLAVVDLLPSGFEAVLSSGDTRIGTQESSWDFEYADIREDRVLLYGDIGQDIKAVVYRIKAVSRGEFAVPPAYMTSMYNPRIMARTGSSSIMVIDNP